MQNPNSSRRVSTKEAATFLNISCSTLRRWRSQDWKGGPKFIRLGGMKGRAIRYEEADLRGWLAANTVAPALGNGA